MCGSSPINIPRTPLWANDLDTTLLIKFPCSFLIDTVYFLNTQGQNKTLNLCIEGFVPVNNSVDVVNFPSLRSVRIGIVENISQAYNSAKCV